MKIIKAAGGLGSQMFAYALYLSLENKYGSKERVVFDTSFFEDYEQHNGYELDRLFNIKTTDASPFAKAISRNEQFLFRKIRKLAFKTIDAKHRNYNFDERAFTHKHAVYNQAWTSWKYFTDCESLVCKTFKFPEFTEPKNLAVFEQIKETNSVAIHVRRGDYLNVPAINGLAPLSYYRKAVEHIESQIDSPTFFIFSDDIAWCKEHLNLEKVVYIDWNTKAESYRDMQLMSLCKHNIIPNSSFSWWGAYLNSNSDKIVVCPEKWGRLELGLELKDMNYPGWIIQKNT
ncbi:alpha-1,2-fucosyltransferase [Vibrio gigantis]|uniref:alpha-1,2-fucosyltransferase n=1 Tax=Vibrio gigantis TaxID=296199 RepID=UPI001EFC142C|nr:alpha-1,2-fucosyltransferase [Vibrio gigantis]ULN64441.1 alpha-1,2-fucosyltransferase [Vibrio gigantis]